MKRDILRSKPGKSQDRFGFRVEFLKPIARRHPAVLELYHRYLLDTLSGGKVPASIALSAGGARLAAVTKIPAIPLGDTIFALVSNFLSTFFSLRCRARNRALRVDGVRSRAPLLTSQYWPSSRHLPIVNGDEKPLNRALSTWNMSPCPCHSPISATQSRTERAGFPQLPPMTSRARREEFRTGLIFASGLVVTR